MCVGSGFRGNVHRFSSRTSASAPSRRIRPLPEGPSVISFSQIRQGGREDKKGHPLNIPELAAELVQPEPLTSFASHPNGFGFRLASRFSLHNSRFRSIVYTLT